MSRFYSPDYVSAMAKLERFGMARDRVTDKEARHVTLTDDEAVAVLDVLAGVEE